MIVSAGEIAETAKKATRGCGYDWGIAEDMGWATRWLNERGFRGAEKLVHALEQSVSNVTPAISRSDAGVSLAHPDGEALSPLTIAPSFAEFLVAEVESNQAVTIASLSHPLLLIPSVARASSQAGEVVTDWQTVDGSRVTVHARHGNVSVIAINSFMLIQAVATEVSGRHGASFEQSDDAEELFSPDQLDEQRGRALNDGCRITDGVWQKLLQFAHQTYVPISDSSRLQGAGAGLTDND